MSKQIYSTPQSQRLTAVVLPADNIYNLDLQTDNSGKSAMNVSPILFDFVTTLGAITVNLPAIADFLTRNSSGLGFQINGTRVGVGFPVTFVADTVAPDKICGDPTKIFSAISCKLWIAGTNNWGFVQCNALT
jgi:hypothetical protein